MSIIDDEVVVSFALHGMVSPIRSDEAIELLRIAVLALPGNARAIAGLAEGYARAGRAAAALDSAEARALVVRARLAGSP